MTFAVMIVYCDLIPDLETKVPAMLAAVKALVAQAGDDGSSGMPNGAFRIWAEKGDSARCPKDGHQFTEAGMAAMLGRGGTAACSSIDWPADLPGGGGWRIEIFKHQLRGGTAAAAPTYRPA